MKITPEQLKRIIKESIDEVIDEVGGIDYHDYEPVDSHDDFDQEYIDDIKNSLNMHLPPVEKDMDEDGEHYDALVDLDNRLKKAMDDNSTLMKMVDNDSELEGLLGRLHRVIGGGSGSSEKFYVNEKETLEEKAPPGMEDFVRKIKPEMMKQYGSKRGLAIAYAVAWKKYRKLSGKSHGHK